MGKKPVGPAFGLRVSSGLAFSGLFSGFRARAWARIQPYFGAKANFRLQFSIQTELALSCLATRPKVKAGLRRQGQGNSTRDIPLRLQSPVTAGSGFPAWA